MVRCGREENEVKVAIHSPRMRAVLILPVHEYGWRRVQKENPIHVTWAITKDGLISVPYK